MEKEKKWLVENLACRKPEEEGYITVEGAEHIRDRILNLLEKAEERVYLSCSCSCLESMEEELQKLVRAGRKLVLITDCTRAGGLEDGEYTLSITTQYASGNRLLKAPRTATLNVPLYVGTKPDDGDDEERPGGL